MKEVIIVGGGASGMMAAISTSLHNENVRVTILEHSPKIGKKLLATGNGRCNLTNKKLNTDCFRSHDGERISMWLNRCDTDRVVSFFRQLGMLCTDKNGYIYPYSCQAATVNDMLIEACNDNNIDIVTDPHVIDVQKNSDGRFMVMTSQGFEDSQGQRKKRRITYEADRVILACGSKAYPSLGSDGSGYGIAKNLGLKMVPVVPALTGLRCRERIYSMAAGVRTQAAIELYVDHEMIASDRGELQLTEYGISGIPVFQVSRFASYGLADGCKVHGNIDFMPDYTYEQVMDILEYNMEKHKNKSIYNILSGMVNNKLAGMLLAYCRISQESVCEDLEDADKKNIVQALKSFYTVVTETNDYTQAQVCAGGVRLSEVDDNFQSVKVSGLYVTGELLDIDGICGGYNLHWAWLTGIIAGENVCQ